MPANTFKQVDAAHVRSALLSGHEICILDPREEEFHAEAHPLFAANLPLSRIELDAPIRLPRRTVDIVIFDNGEEIAEITASRLIELGFQNVALLRGGLQGWIDAGYEVFRDVNSPSKAFGELVEAQAHTPSLSAAEVQALIASGADIAIVDARRFDEFNTMNIPTSHSAPGAELVLRMRDLATRPNTGIIINCAGRTRSIIGTQSLINARQPNSVAALRNGTIGWKLAKQTLEHGSTRVRPFPPPEVQEDAACAARRVADAAGVKRISPVELSVFTREEKRTTYLFDVRSPDEFAKEHLQAFRNAPGGQLVQETDMYAPVRGARIVLFDDDGTRANMTASWLAQMNWDVYVLDGVLNAEFKESANTGHRPSAPAISFEKQISPKSLAELLRKKQVAILDFSHSRIYRKRHIPGSQFALRTRLDEALSNTSNAEVYVLTSTDSLLAQFACNEMSTKTSIPTFVLNGGNETWHEQGFESTGSDPAFASSPVDYYKRPYEGVDATEEKMQAYLDWEFGLVEQLHRDATHGFWVLTPESSSC